MKKLAIGGEYFYSPIKLLKENIFSLDNYLENKFPGKKYLYSFGGYYAITQILRILNLKNDETVLLPSYLCPSILIPFNKGNVKYKFYKINENLEIDIDDIKIKLDHTIKAIFVINYFGFAANTHIRTFLENLKAQKIIIIEDIVHSFFSEIPLIGDFAFNSFRKFLPIDGSVIISNKKIFSSIKKSYNKYFFYKLIGHWIRYIHITYGIFPAVFFLKLFQTAEKHYYNDDIYSFNKYNRYILSRSDIDELKEKRKNNFKILLSNFPSEALLKHITDDIIPLGFPIIVNNRDTLRATLIKKNIFCPIHWRLTDTINRSEFKESWHISDHILTIPINENIDEYKLKYLIDTITKSL